jgi:hypothetical protein
LQYLSESMGDGTPASTLELWQGAHQPDADNSVTWMDALEQWLEPRWPGPQPMGDESYTELAWQEFAEWRYFVGEHADDEHFQHGWYSATDIGLELPNITTADFSLFVGEPLERDLRFGMAETSSGVVPIRYPEVGASVTVDLVADAGEDRWALSLMSLDAVGGVIDRVRGAIAPGEATVTAIVPEGTLQMITVVANVGDGVLDPNEDDWEGTSGVLVFSTDAEAAPADDDDSEPTEEGGCECAAASVDAPIGWIGIVALVGVCGARRRGGSMRTTQGDPDARRP